MLAGHLITDINVRLLTNPDDAILNGEDRQRSKASAPRMARLELTASLRSACSLRRGHFVNNLNVSFVQPKAVEPWRSLVHLPGDLVTRSR